ncbi:Glucosamine-phosphate N-acetyltransferase-like protein [Haplosporangium sp. Z 767]|nr:Glucosamine-phosphate N-acetyltransferase-like protein [Haplosporangium sp. Z 767]
MNPQQSASFTSTTSLFSPSLISSSVQAQLPEGYRMRPLEATDYHKGFYDCLAGLTVVGNVSEKAFLQTFETMRRCESVYHTVVIEELCNQRIVATGTLIVEQKFLRGCAKAGHIEDIVVHDSQRGKKFGIRLIEQLKHIGTLVGCYKMLLTCAESNEVFYEKSGFKRKDLHMAQYIEPSAPAPVQAQILPALQTSQQAAMQLPQQPVQSLQQQQPLTCAQQAMSVALPVNNTSDISLSSFSSSSSSSSMSSTTLSTSSASSTTSSSASSTAPSSPSSPSTPTATRAQQPLTINVNVKRNANGHGVPLEPLSASVMEAIFVN